MKEWVVLSLMSLAISIWMANEIANQIGALLTDVGSQLNAVLGL